MTLAWIASLTMAVAAVPVASPGYDSTRLRQDVAAIHKAGVTGVEAQVWTPSRRMSARAGVADIRGNRSMPVDGYFRIASTTKSFVATVVLQLAAERKVSLDAGIEKYLPGLVRGRGNDGRTITVRQLLQHTSGLHDYANDLFADLVDRKSWRKHRLDRHSAEELVKMALRHKPQFKPGTRWAYSNTNYLLAGMIIKKVTGKSWDREVRERIAKPLGLRHTFNPTTPYLPKPHARAYVKFRPAESWTDTTVSRDNFADGGLVSTITDLNRFFRALIGGQVLPAAQLAEMKKTVPADVPDIPGQRYGLGLFWTPLTCGGGYWGHGGDGAGHKSREGILDDGRHSVVVFTQSMILDNTATQRHERADQRLIDHALCAAKAPRR
ncbi:serine hydrolase domain-containing protein [Nonomuraea sp. JJY05]|jgi:D-alanyl-D-alanine carboxypeptidase|uniref:serine hydrolase domain-containing protein n=1 Tax=Nonomuraea sp. JJY05 TaxID=3350255 RepID=UPI00373E92BC